MNVVTISTLLVDLLRIVNVNKPALLFERKREKWLNDAGGSE